VLCALNSPPQVLDPVSAPKWRLDCNRCSFMLYLPPNLHSVKVSKKEACEVSKPMSPSSPLDRFKCKGL